MAPKAKTYSIDIYNFVRGEILSCRFRPGMRLKIQDLCELHDVSNGAVREALSKLTAEGLVLLEPQKGYSVTPVSLAEYLDLTEARIRVEELCIRMSMEHRSVDWEAEVVSAYYKLSKIKERDSDDPSRLNEQWSIAHAHFHAALVAACPVQYLLRFRSQLYEQSERYRRLSVPLRHAERNVDEEHSAIKEAVLAQDFELMATLIRNHLSATADILVGSGLFETALNEVA